RTLRQPELIDENPEGALGESVEFPSLRHHIENHLQAPLACVGLSGSLQTPSDGVAIGFVQRVEEGLCLLVLRERAEEVGWNLRLARRIVGCVPAAVALRLLDLPQA